MGAYLTRRIASAAVTLLGILTAVFLLIHAAPGDPVLLYAGIRPGDPVPAAVLDAIRSEHGLDRTVPEQYFQWVMGAARLDFRDSIRFRRPVTEVVLDHLPPTVLLGGMALLVALAVSLPLGAATALRPGSRIDRATGTLLFLLYSLPSFWLALLLIELFGIRLGVLPLFGMSSPRAYELGGLERLADRLLHLVLPVTVLAYGLVALLTRFVRSALLETLHEEYITTARAKGVSPAAVLWKHAWRNSMIPVLSLLGLIIPWLVSGSIIVEQIFQWNGIGRLFFSAILSRDYPLVMGLTLLTAVVTLLASLLADLAIVAADPRVRLEGGRK